MKNANNAYKWTIYFRFSGFTWLPSVLVVSTWFQQFYKHLPHPYLLLKSFTKYWKSNIYSERFCLWMVAAKVSFRLSCEHHIFCLKNSFSLCCRCTIKPRSVMSMMSFWHLCLSPLQTQQIAGSFLKIFFHLGSQIQTVFFTGHWWHILKSWYTEVGPRTRISVLLCTRTQPELRFVCGAG